MSQPPYGQQQQNPFAPPAGYSQGPSSGVQGGASPNGGFGGGQYGPPQGGQYGPPQGGQYAGQQGAPAPGYGPPQGGYGQPNAYGQAAYAPNGFDMARETQLREMQQNGLMWLLAGVIGFFFGFGWISGPLAWYFGGKLRKDYKAMGVEPTNEATGAWVVGIVTTAITWLAILAAILFFVMFFGAFFAAASSAAAAGAVTP